MNRLIAPLISLAVGTSVVAAQRPVPSHQAPALPRQGVHAVARVGGATLTSDRLESAVSALVPMESFHRAISAEKMAAIRRKALEQLIDEELQYQEGMRLGVRATSAEVEAGVEAAAARYGGRRAFEDALRQTGATLAQARAEIARTITIQKTVARAVTKTCRVGRSEAAAFFRSNPQRFVEPEQLHIYAITIGVEPSSNAGQWAAARSRAEEVRRQIAAGASFEDMARTYSTDASKARGGDMGFVHRGSLSDQFEQIAKTLPPGGTSDVVETLYGYASAAGQGRDVSLFWSVSGQIPVGEALRVTGWIRQENIDTESTRFIQHGLSAYGRVEYRFRRTSLAIEYRHSDSQARYSEVIAPDHFRGRQIRVSISRHFGFRT